MKFGSLLALGALALAALSFTSSTEAGHRCSNCGRHGHHGHHGNWGGGHGGGFGGSSFYNGEVYSHVMYGQPVALVVPPQARTQVDYQWGAKSTDFSRINGRFRYGGGGYGGSYGGYTPAPYWPSHTGQIGVYYHRAPWGY